MRGHLEENVYYIDIPTGELIDDIWQRRRCTADHPACSDPRETQTLVVCLQKGKYSGSPASKILLLPITGTFTLIQFSRSQRDLRKRSGSVVECLTRDRRATGSNLTGVTALCPGARHIYPCLVLVQPRKTSPNITERLLTGT